MCSVPARESGCITTSISGSVDVTEFSHHLSRRADDRTAPPCFDARVQLNRADVVELAAGLPLALELEPYRERLAPLAVAVLEGGSRRAIDKRRELVLADVWDGRLREAAIAGIADLRQELERKLGVLQAAEADLEQPVRKGKLARELVDRVLGDLLAAHDANLAALEQLERELRALPPDARPARAAVAARGAYSAVRIPQNELRAAIVRAARVAQKQRFHEDGVAEQAAVLVACALATDERRRLARTWVGRLAEGSAEAAPSLADALLDLAATSASTEADSDLIWIQACVGLTLETGLAMS
jgi:hypothetical protein